MMWWDSKRRERLSDEGVNWQMYKRCVYYINIVVQAKKSIQLEADHPTRYINGKVPILDLKGSMRKTNKFTKTT